jgi:hypothetical protein
MIPENICFQTGLIPVKDGSLRYIDGLANEYASVIMTKNNVMHAIKKQTEALNKYCERSFNESLHLHIGNYPVEEDKITNLFSIAKELEGEVFSLFPGFSKSTSIYKNTRKDYCKKLPSYKNKEFTFNDILSFLTEGEITDKNYYEKGMYNPINPNGQHKWNVSARYSFINFDSLIFGKANTVEFRVHTTTFNKEKVAAWVFLTSAILLYASEQPYFKGLKLKDVIEYSYASKSRGLNEFLLQYVEYRKKFISKCHDKYKDFIGIIDIYLDSLSDFKFIKKRLI